MKLLEHSKWTAVKKIHNCMLNDVSIFKLQTYLGHSSVSTTENYLKDFGLDYLNYTSRVNK